MEYKLVTTERDKNDELWYLFVHKKTGTLVRIHTNDYQAFIARELK